MKVAWTVETLAASKDEPTVAYSVAHSVVYLAASRDEMMVVEWDAC